MKRMVIDLKQKCTPELRKILGCYGNRCVPDSEIKCSILTNDGYCRFCSCENFPKEWQCYIEQLRWERDMAIEQLESYGVGFGEKADVIRVDVDCLRKPKEKLADSTLKRMTKDNLIEYVRTLERNYDIAISFNAQQAKKFGKLIIEKIKDNSLDFNYLYAWYIKSVDNTETPVWTDEHIDELLNDFYIIPKEE